MSKVFNGQKSIQLIISPSINKNFLYYSIIFSKANSKPRGRMVVSSLIVFFQHLNDVLGANSWPKSDNHSGLWDTCPICLTYTIQFTPDLEEKQTCDREWWVRMLKSRRVKNMRRWIYPRVPEPYYKWILKMQPWWSIYLKEIIWQFLSSWNSSIISCNPRKESDHKVAPTV